MEENEHELILTCRYADFNSDDLPAPGDSVTIGSKTYPVSVTHYVAGNGELELIVRDSQHVQQFIELKGVGPATTKQSTREVF